MNKKLLISVLVVILILLAVIFITTRTERTEEYSLAAAQEIAENWVKNECATYLYDGENLEFVESETISEDTYSFHFYFETRTAGYGDRSDQMVAQVITPRDLLVVVEKNTIIEAITDSYYNELTGEAISISKEEPETMIVELYFGKEGEDTEIFSIEREIEKRIDTARASLEELLKGPLASEEGYFTSIPSGVMIQALVIEEGVAKVDFSSELEEGVAGSATVTAIREQIEKTLLQFPTVEEVIISIDGRTEDILQP